MLEPRAPPAILNIRVDDARRWGDTSFDFIVFPKGDHIRHKLEDGDIRIGVLARDDTPTAAQVETLNELIARLCKNRAAHIHLGGEIRGKSPVYPLTDFAADGRTGQIPLLRNR